MHSAKSVKTAAATNMNLMDMASLNMTATRLSGPFGLEVQIVHEPHSVFGERKM
jgi:hypothetical protein